MLRLLTKICRMRPGWPIARRGRVGRDHNRMHDPNQKAKGAKCRNRKGIVSIGARVSATDAMGVAVSSIYYPSVPVVPISLNRTHPHRLCKIMHRDLPFLLLPWNRPRVRAMNPLPLLCLQKIGMSNPFQLPWTRDVNWCACATTV